MRHLEQDNASLRNHVDSRNGEIARLRAVVDGLHRSPPQAVPLANDVLSRGPGNDCQVRQRLYTKCCRSVPGFCNFSWRKGGTAVLCTC